jgi:tetratricopeptide (TPR) repeat protein
MRDYHKALSLCERITAAQPADAEATSKLAIVHCRIGELLRDKGDLNTGVNHNRKAVTLMEGVIASGNNSPEARENLAWCYTSLADVVGNPILANLGDFTTAMGYYERGLKLRDELLAENPSDPDRGKMTSIAHERIGMMLQARKDLPGAMEHFRRSLELDEPFLKEDPANIGKQRQLALDYQYLAAAAWDAEQVAEAKNYQIQNIQLAEKMVQNDPNDANIKITLATGYVRMLYMLGRSGDMAGANEYAQKAMRIAEALVARDPNNVGKLALIRGVDERMADLYLRAGDGAAALPYARDELELNARMFAIQPANTNVRRSQAATHAQLGKAYKLVASAAGANDAQEHWQNARAEFQQSLEIYEELKAKGVLVGGEAAKPEQVANELASCQ